MTRATTTARSSMFQWVPTSTSLLEDAEKEMLKPISVPYEQKMVPISGNNHINTIKAGNGPPLVLLHGFAAGLGFWNGNINALSRRYTVYACDLLGFGRSSRPSTSFKSSQEAEDFFTDSIEQWTQQLGLTNFVLAGHSMGGYIAGCYALKYHHRIHHLIMCDPWGIPEAPKEVNRSFRYRFFITLFSAVSPLGVMRAAGPWGIRLITKVRGDIAERFEDIMENNMEVVPNYIFHTNGQTPATGEHAFAALTDKAVFAKDPLIHRLDKLPESVPSTFIYGEHTWMDKNAGLRLSQNMKGAVKFLEVPNAGHHLYIDNSPVFNNYILSVAEDLTSNYVQEGAGVIAPEDVSLTEEVLTE